MAGTSPLRGFAAFEQQQQPQQQLQQQAQAAEGPQASEIQLPGTPPPEHHNIGSPGGEAGDANVIIEQMHQMMAMLKEQLAALEKKATPTAAAGSADAVDPLYLKSPWPVRGPPGVDGATRLAGNPGGGQTGGGAEGGFNTVHAHEASASRQQQADVMRTDGHPGPKPLDTQDIEKPNN